MKITRSMQILVNIVVLLFGVIFILIGVLVTSSTLLAIFEAIGTGLLAAGAVNILDRLLSTEVPQEGIETVTPKRILADPGIYEMKYRVDKVDILGYTNYQFFHEIVTDSNERLINRILFHSLRLRVVFVHPESQHLKFRVIEDGTGKESEPSLIEKQKQSVQMSVQFYKQLRERYERALESGSFDRRTAGSVEIRLTKFCPHFSIYRVGDVIYWGLYPSDTIGDNAPLFKTSKDSNYLVYDSLKKHFTAQREKMVDIGEDFMIVNTMLGEPKLNTKLAEEILGHDIVQFLLK